MAARQSAAAGVALAGTVKRLTTGLRVNSAADDPAGLAIGTNLKAQLVISAQAQRNLNDAVSALSVAGGALEEATKVMTRISQLAQEASTGTLSARNRADLDSECQGLVGTLAGLATGTLFNGQGVLGETLQVASGSLGNVSFTVPAMDQGGGTLVTEPALASAVSPGQTLTLSNPVAKGLIIRPPSNNAPVQFTADGVAGTVTVASVAGYTTPFQATYNTIPSTLVTNGGARNLGGGSYQLLNADGTTATDVSDVTLTDRSGQKIPFSFSDPANGIVTLAGAGPIGGVQFLTVARSAQSTSIQAQTALTLTPSLGFPQHLPATYALGVSGASLTFVNNATHTPFSLTEGVDYTLATGSPPASSQTLTLISAANLPASFSIKAAGSQFVALPDASRIANLVLKNGSRTLTRGVDFTLDAADGYLTLKPTALTASAGLSATYLAVPTTDQTLTLNAVTAVTLPEPYVDRLALDGVPLTQGTDYTADTAHPGVITFSGPTSGTLSFAGPPTLTTFSSLPLGETSGETVPLHPDLQVLPGTTSYEGPAGGIQLAENNGLVEGTDYLTTEVGRDAQGTAMVGPAVQSLVNIKAGSVISYEIPAYFGFQPGSDFLLTASAAQSTAALAAAGLAQASTGLAGIGAFQEQLTAMSSVLGARIQGLTQAESGIMDANVADEVVALTRGQILGQSANMGLVQANKASSSLLNLLG